MACEVVLVAFGEVSVVFEASFEFGEAGGGGVEGGGDVGEGEAAGGALVAQAVAVGDDRRVGEQFVGLAGDVALEAAQGLPGVLPSVLRRCA